MTLFSKVAAMSKKLKTIGCCLIFALAGLISTASASTLRCGDRLVSVGDTKAEVMIKCGAPAWRDNWTNEIITGVDTVREQRVSVARERWVYNLGPKSFLRFLLFKNGRLVEITDGDYGYDEKHPSISPCDDDEVSTGLSQYEILQRCGQPFFEDSREEERMVTIDKKTSKLTNVRIDEWTYNLGPNRFLRILKFENGKLVDVEDGDRGF